MVALAFIMLALFVVNMGAIMLMSQVCNDGDIGEFFVVIAVIVGLFYLNAKFINWLMVTKDFMGV